MPNRKLSEIATTSSGYNSDSYLIATSTVGSLQDIRFSFAQIAGAIFGNSFGFRPASLSLLPASSTVPGARASVVDSQLTSSSYGASVIGGGPFTTPVFSDGSTSWKIG